MESFDSEDGLKRFTLLDANQDGITWKYDAEQKLVRYDYNDYKSGDDWLFTPLLTWKANTRYKVSFDTKCKSISYSERMEVTLGSTADPEMHVPLAEPIEVMWNDAFRTTEIEFTVPESGTMCLGFHEISDAGMYYLLLDNIRIQEYAAEVVVPAAVEEGTVVPGEKGALTAAVSFRIPDKDVEGKTLQELDRVDVYRNNAGTPVYTAEEMQLGEWCSFEDTVTESGEYTYTFVAVNRGGESEPYSLDVYIGYDLPDKVGNLLVTNRKCEVQLSWEEPLRGMHDGFLDREKLTYTVTDRNGNVIGENLKACYLEHRVELENVQQELAGYVVYASNGGMEGCRDTTRLIVVGEPYATPMNESFGMGTVFYYPWYSEKTGSQDEKYWIAMTYGYSPQAYAQDDDAGLLTFRSMVAPKGTEERFLSPVFELKELVNPALVFYMYHTGDEEHADRLLVEVAADGGGFREVGGPYVLGEGPELAWSKHVVPLEAYAGCDSVVIALKGVSAEGRNIHVDNVAIVDDCRDLALETLTTEMKTVDPNVEFKMEVLVGNPGTEDVDSYSIELFRNGERIRQVDGRELPAGQDSLVEFVWVEPVTVVGQQLEFWAEVVCEDDRKPANNRSETLWLEVARPRLPEVEKLEAAVKDGNVSLTWKQAEEFVNHPLVNEGFETYETFITENVGPWKLVDEDLFKTGIFDKSGEYPHRGEPMAYQVFDPDLAGLDMEVYQYTWGNREGSRQYLLSLYNEGDIAPNDDWLISPEVADDKQIVFYAKSVTRGYKLEQIEVLYSDGTDATEDFRLLDEQTVPDRWTMYRYRLPEGTRYFAVRHTTWGGLGLMLDDISYAPVTDHPEREKPLGYRVYRNDSLLTEEPVTEPEYTDRANEGECYQYRVTAVYPAGESALSEPVEVVVTGIQSAGNGQEVIVRPVEGGVEVCSERNGKIRVYDLNGRLVAVTDKRNVTERIELPEGVWLLHFAGRVFKLSD